ncbi:NAC domain-containing protein [Phascolomyces articulosus]|uniref:Nascent polypeptide-associated complex subunit alpha n=1 Tax=Phascolomyces articulosus TaxID=60185 RepID=A0AAD5KGM1_9FUNG|nr:NAC domain-containing protein [Phascolomyces articulosus]
MSAQVDEKPVEQKVEEVVEETTQQVEVPETEVESPQSRGEKKARKAILGLGLKQVPGITRVTFTRARGIVFAIARPEVFKSNNSDTYIVFGEVQVEDMRARAQQAAAQQLAAEAAAKAEETEAAAPSTVAAESASAAVVEEDDDEEVDATGVEEKDIELVVSQANVSRNKAIKALKNNSNDIVNAIMELTM